MLQNNIFTEILLVDQDGNLVEFSEEIHLPTPAPPSPERVNLATELGPSPRTAPTLSCFCC